MSLNCLSQVPRPSSLPLARSVTELLPPPCVPNDLCTPSPLRSIPSPATIFKPSSLRTLHMPQSNLKKASGIPSPSETRLGSLSPPVPATRTNLKSKNAPPEKPRLVESVIVTNVSHNTIKGELKPGPHPVGMTLAMTTRKNSINKVGAGQGQQKQLSHQKGQVLKKHPNHQTSQVLQKQLNNPTSQVLQKQLNNPTSQLHQKQLNHQKSQGLKKQLNNQTSQELQKQLNNPKRQQKRLNNQTGQGQQKQKRTISVHNKKPQPLRDENRPPENTFHREPGKRVSPNHPDLVKVSSPRTNEDRFAELQRQINASDQNNYVIKQQLLQARLESKRNAIGFEAMTAVVGYLVPHALNTPELKAKVAVMQQEIQNAKNTTKLLEYNQEVFMKKRDDEWNEDKHQLELMYEQNVKLLLEKHHQDMINQSFQVVQKQKEKHLEELQKYQATISHREEYIAEMIRRNEEELYIWKNKHAKIARKEEYMDNILTGYQEQISELVGKHEEELNSWKTKHDNLEGQIKAIHETMIENADFQLQVVNKNLHKEIDSLKTVVDMRTAEVHDLRADRSRLQEKLELFESTQENLSKSIAQVEDLREQISAKLDVERKLSEEKRALNHSLEKEFAEKKRLSMENEQLFYKIRQTSESEDVLVSEDCMLDPRIHHTALQRCGSRGGGRPVSAPPGKETFVSSPRSFDQEVAGGGPIPPESPRVLEFVEKNDSMSWKIEFMDMTLCGDGQSLKQPSSRQEECFGNPESSPDDYSSHP